MRRIVPILLVLMIGFGCNSAADKGKPAMAPVLTERPILSSAWATEPGKFYVGARLFTVGVDHNLFNRISVRLSGQEAIELPRGSSTSFRPIDRSGLEAGKVYFRITVEQTDANQQTERDALEVFDNASLFVDAPGTASELDLIVRETSINPRYAGTSDEFKEASTKVVFSRDLSGPSGQGGRTRCEFSFPVGFSQTSRTGLPGAHLAYSFSSAGCKALGVLKDGERSNVVELQGQDVSGRYGDVFFDVPADAQVGQVIEFQIFGLDLLKRPMYFNARAHVKAAPPPKPCNTNNGAAGNLIQYRYCAVCGDTERIPVSNYSCNATEAQQAAQKSLADSGHTGCSLSVGDCPICPVSTSNPTGQIQQFQFCVAAPSAQFGWYIKEETQPACKIDAARADVELRNSNSVVTASPQQTFPICVVCPGVAVRRADTPACTESQAIDIQKAINPGCEVKRCP